MSKIFKFYFLIFLKFLHEQDLKLCFPIFSCFGENIWFCLGQKKKFLWEEVWNLKSFSWKFWHEYPKSFSGTMYDLDLKSLNRTIWDLNFKSFRRKIWYEHLKSFSWKFWDEYHKTFSGEMCDLDLKSLGGKKRRSHVRKKKRDWKSYPSVRKLKMNISNPK